MQLTDGIYHARYNKKDRIASNHFWNIKIRSYLAGYYMKQNYRVTVRLENNDLLFMEGKPQETLLETLLRYGILYRAECGGRGSCGKCKVRVTDGYLKPTIQDEKMFSQEELKAGYRLSCKATPEEDVTIVLCSPADQEMKAVIEHRVSDNIKAETENTDNTDRAFETEQATSSAYIIAIDLGTTTLAFQLSDAVSGIALSTYTLVNPQRIYGADVISRIKASVEGKREELQVAIQKSLLRGIREIINQSGIAPGDVTQLGIAGNTTMIHLLLGYSCETLGVYPFLPVNQNTHNLSVQELFATKEAAGVNRATDEEKNRAGVTDNGNSAQGAESKELVYRLKNVPVMILPGVSAFIGGDIVAGMAVCGFQSSESIRLLIDFGTNGELALGNRDKLLVASTAAGPAFEGGNISCGTGSIPGAVSHVTIEGDSIQYETIALEEPKGICGTGVIELVSELYRNGILDETGLLCEQYFSDGYPVKYRGITAFTLLQKDIREFQLAKAAIRAGVEVLLHNYGITYEQVDRIYLAGGFGFYLNIEKAVRIGLLPEEWKDRIVTIGNSSLAGAEQAVRRRDHILLLEELARKAQEVQLSLDPDFNELYLRYMSFH